MKPNGRSVKELQQGRTTLQSAAAAASVTKELEQKTPFKTRSNRGSSTLSCTRRRQAWRRSRAECSMAKKKSERPMRTSGHSLSRVSISPHHRRRVRGRVSSTYGRLELLLHDHKDSRNPMSASEDDLYDKASVDMSSEKDRRTTLRWMCEISPLSMQTVRVADPWVS